MDDRCGRSESFTIKWQQQPLILMSCFTMTILRTGFLKYVSSFSGFRRFSKNLKI